MRIWGSTGITASADFVALFYQIALFYFDGSLFQVTQGSIQIIIMFNNDCISPVIFQIHLPDDIVGNAVHDKFNSAIGRSQDHLVVTVIVSKEVSASHKLLTLGIGNDKIPCMTEFIFMGIFSVMSL